VMYHHHHTHADEGGWLSTACVWLGSYIALCLAALCLTVGLFYLSEVRRAVNSSRTVLLSLSGLA
jgi:hypothetical protein